MLPSSWATKAGIVTSPTSHTVPLASAPKPRANREGGVMVPGRQGPAACCRKRAGGAGIASAGVQRDPGWGSAPPEIMPSPALACQHNQLALMATITVRGLGGDDLAALKQAAEREGISMNRLALRRLVDQPPAAAIAGPSMLDALAGTWSQQEAECFQAAIAPLGQVDPDLWG